MPQVLAPRVRHGREPTEGTYSMLRPPARGLVDFSLGGWSTALVEPGERAHAQVVEGEAGEVPRGGAGVLRARQAA